MFSTFLTLRYIAFALFIIFNSAICIIASVNLGSLAANTDKFPEVDSYLIVTGALGLVCAFSVVFVELIRKNAFITRVIVEIVWIGLLWVMNLSGAAATTSISSQIHCSPTDIQPAITCISERLLLAFTWLNTVTLLSYLLGLVICTVHQSQENSHIWRSGVRDYTWFTQRTIPQDPPESAFSYGKLVDPQELAGPPPLIYAQQMGLSRNYAIEPLRFEETTGHVVPPGNHIQPIPTSAVERPVPPVPAASFAPRRSASGSKSNGVIRPTQPSSSAPYSLYPQHLQAAVGALPTLPPRTGESSPPPAGPWPRPNPQEPPRRKRRSALDEVNRSAASAPSPPDPEMSQQGPSSAPSWSGAGRSRPTGPRTLSSQRPRPPPLDLARLDPRNNTGY